MRIDKRYINRRLKSLEETNRVKVFNFSHLERMPRGSVGFPDYVIVGYKFVIFAELKLGKDKLSKKQEEFRDFCEKSQLNYFVINENNIDKFIELIINLI